MSRNWKENTPSTTCTMSTNIPSTTCEISTNEQSTSSFEMWMKTIPIPTSLTWANNTPTSSMSTWPTWTNNSLASSTSTWPTWANNRPASSTSTWPTWANNSSASSTSRWPTWANNSPASWTSTWPTWANNSPASWTSTWPTWANNSPASWTSTWPTWVNNSPASWTSTWPTWVNNSPAPSTSVLPSMHSMTGRFQLSPPPTLTMVNNAALGSEMVTQYVQQVFQSARFCFRCNAVYRFEEQHITKSCQGSHRFQSKYEFWFECYNCVIRGRLQDFCTHVATEPHNARSNLNNQYVSYFCSKCNTVLYSPWSITVQHRSKCNTRAGVCSMFEKQLPSMTGIMRRLLKDYLDCGRRTLKFVCVHCKHYGTEFYNPIKNCSVCVNLDLKFYCQSCNVVFTCLKLGYDIHLHTFEHLYIAKCRMVENKAVPGGW